MKVTKFDSGKRGERISIQFWNTEHWMDIGEANDLASQILGTGLRDADDLPDSGRMVLIKVWAKHTVVVDVDDPESDRLEDRLMWRVGYHDHGWWDARNGVRAKPLAWCEILMPPTV